MGAIWSWIFGLPTHSTTMENCRLVRCLRPICVVLLRCQHWTSPFAFLVVVEPIGTRSSYCIDPPLQVVLFACSLRSFTFLSHQSSILHLPENLVPSLPSSRQWHEASKAFRSRQLSLFRPSFIRSLKSDSFRTTRRPAVIACCWWILWSCIQTASTLYSLFVFHKKKWKKENNNAHPIMEDGQIISYFIWIFNSKIPSHHYYVLYPLIQLERERKIEPSRNAMLCSGTCFVFIVRVKSIKEMWPMF